MVGEIMVSATTEAEAVEEAVNRLGVDQDAIEYEVKPEADEDLLPGAKPEVEVRAWIRPQYMADLAENQLRSLLDAMVITDYTIEIRVDQGIVYLNVIAEEDSSLLIGRDGQNLHAIQYLVSRMTTKSAREAPMVMIDIEGYRKRQYGELEELVELAVERARETGNEIELDSMGSSTRKYLHNFLRRYEGIKTFSRGEDPERYLVIVAD